MAGPLFWFRRVFAQIAEGDLRGSVRVREHDYVVEEAEALDRMLSALRDRVRRSQEAAGEVRMALTELSCAAGPVPPRKLAALLARAEEAESTLAEFATGVAVPDAEPLEAGARPRTLPKFQLSFPQMLGAVLLFLTAAIAMAVPAYTSALGHAREIRANRQHDRTELTPATTPRADLREKIR